MGINLLPYTNLHELNLDWFLDEFKKIKQELQKQGVDITELTQKVSELEEILEAIESGEYNDFYLTPVKKWIDDNLIGIVGRLVKYVFFGLSDEGYFIANIPASWQFIKFDTIQEPDSDFYGHLILRW